MLQVFGIDLSQVDGFVKLNAYVQYAQTGEDIREMMEEVGREIKYAKQTGLVRNVIVLENVFELIHNYGVARGL